MAEQVTKQRFKIIIKSSVSLGACRQTMHEIFACGEFLLACLFKQVRNFAFVRVGVRLGLLPELI
jgi:hypothetical protein